ncbi:MAG: 5-methyltetrahydropteroyltriglutamate--homocysteine S-methyltransferase [Helicobacteraceae bacterium]|jgi:5-methyltetrahydropteroyltriglutamate--homocysteine methyltransferase|nr:5-methyltetrahydropteroyltriglutamate--homocysteine S-methyltransferase [Helicobacteraceae bacterium]
MKTHILGFPSIGKFRELKQALESFWKGELSEEALFEKSVELKKRHWSVQKNAGLDYVVTGDFSLYDRALDLTFAIGAIAPRFAPLANANALERYFAMARGDAKRNIAAMEMTKWFDTNYHYIAPEINASAQWTPNAHPIVEDTRLAKSLGFNPKPALIGPFTYLTLARSIGEADKYSTLDRLVEFYAALIKTLSDSSDLVQIEEPILCAETLPSRAAKRFGEVYATLKAAAGGKAKLALTTYFGSLGDHLERAAQSGCDYLHIDLARGEAQLDDVLRSLPNETALSLGLVNGRNIWKTDYSKALKLIEKAVSKLGEDRVAIASSCSLAHCPVDLDEERALPKSIKDRMAFAAQKCAEITELRDIFVRGDKAALAANQAAFENAAKEADIYNAAVRDRAAKVTPDMLNRRSPYEKRREAQSVLNLPLLPTTTIGSFPQTAAIRKVRLAYKKGEVSEAEYIAAIKRETQDCVEKQERLGLDVFAHGESERNDMVEYFGQQLGGFCFTQNGWVQSYGSRCVKPPVIYGDVYRKAPMTIDWITYAQSLTKKPMKGMLTGPITILCWSFVREDLERSEVCKQIALAIRDEVLDLEKAGVRVIQIDEAALREGMPLNANDAQQYLRWAIDSFRLAASGVEDKTQIHTHMCYSEFNSILEWIAKMDADVISIESSRSGMALLSAFADFNYPSEVGPGVYDIHSPRVPSIEEIAELLRKALLHIPKERLWVNPDCGLKTRGWEEAYNSLENMVAAAKIVRAELSRA